MYNNKGGFIKTKGKDNMNILPIDNVNSKTGSFRGVKVLGNASPEIKELINSSILKNAEQDLLVLSNSCKVGPYDYNHAQGTKLYELKLVKKPETFWDKFLLRLGITSGEFITNGYRSERGIKELLSEKRLSAILNKRG